MVGTQRKEGLPPDIHLMGVNHKTLSVMEREALARVEKNRTDLLGDLRRGCEMGEVSLLSTCNRFEVLYVGNNAASEVINILQATLDVPISSSSFYRYRNEEAYRHLFNVASSLDSMVVGEAQILGQVREAYRKSVALGYAGRYLHQLYQQALRIAKKVRTHTKIAERGVSISSIAVRLAQQIFGELSDRTVLIVGSGKMAELAALHLKTNGCENIIVANRTQERAVELAEQIGGKSISLSEIAVHLSQVDVVIGSIAIDRPLIEISSLVKTKRAKPIFLIDLGVPRNFSPSLAKVDDVYLYNIDDLAVLAEENKALRDDAAKDAELIVEYGVFQFSRWLKKVAADPDVIDFRKKVESVCDFELRRVLEKTVEPDRVSEILPELSHRISQKLSHEVTRVMSSAANGQEGDWILSGEEGEWILSDEPPKKPEE